MTYVCDPDQGKPWRLEGTECVFNGGEYTADVTEVFKRNCGDWHDFRDPARCVPKNIRHAARFVPSGTGCGNSSLHIKPDLLRVAAGQVITIGADVHLDPTVEYVNPDHGWTKSSWSMNGVKFSDQGSIQWSQSKAGSYLIALEVNTNMSGNCSKLNDSVVIEVTEAPVVPTTCPTGQTKDASGSCVPITCPDGQTLDNSGNCVNLPPQTCDPGYTLDPITNTCKVNPPAPDMSGSTLSCPEGTYNSGGICSPIPGYSSVSDRTPTGYDVLSSNYQTASSYSDVFKTPERDTAAAASSLSTPVIIGLAIAGIGGIYYLSTLNVKSRNY
jgi:hypothetical protein